MNCGLRISRVESNAVGNSEHDLPRAIFASLGQEPDGRKVTVNRNVACATHRDGNQGTSWLLILGAFEGGALVFEDGRRIEERGVWHEIDGNVTHWNEPITAGERYSVIVYRVSGPSKASLILKRKRENAAL